MKLKHPNNWGFLDNLGLLIGWCKYESKFIVADVMASILKHRPKLGKGLMWLSLISPSRSKKISLTCLTTVMRNLSVLNHKLDWSSIMCVWRQHLQADKNVGKLCCSDCENFAVSSTGIFTFAWVRKKLKHPQQEWDKKKSRLTIHL